MASDFESTLELIATDLKACSAPWWIFGGAAMSLHGLASGPVKDIDILMSVHDARMLKDRHGLANFAGGDDSLFRSEVLLHPDYGTLPVEIMAGFEIRSNGIWRRVEPISRMVISLQNTEVYIPARRDLAEIFRLGGRPKDLARAALLTA